MICPRCSVSEISATTGACEVCGYVPSGPVGVDAPQPDATDGLARAQLAHQFRIDVLLGQGAVSAVYLAREQDSNRHIVLKVLPRTSGRPDIDARFRDAIAAAKALDHPHLVPVLRHGETDSLLWYTMEHRRARPLREVLRTGGRLDHRACLRLVTQTAAALDYLHRRGAIHGRLKPENVLVDAENWVYVCDAMVARAMSGTLDEAKGERPESRDAAYRAPEDALGGFVGPASDQYALAVLIQECLTGMPPAKDAGGGTAPALAALRPDLPAHLGHAVARALSARPNDRYPGILDFVTALESGGPTMMDARPSGRASDLILTIPGWQPVPKQRPPWLIPAVVGAGVVVLGVIGLVLFNKSQSRSRQDQNWRTSPLVEVAPPAPAAESVAPPVAGRAPEVPRGSTKVPTRFEIAPTRGIVDMRAPRQGRRTRNPDAVSTDAPRAAAPSAPAAPAPPPAPAPASAAGADGRLFVNASPWGQVFVDGQLVGNTPKANLPIAPGTHTIRVARDGFEPVERTVRVNPGEAVRLTDLVLTPRP